MLLKGCVAVLALTSVTFLYLLVAELNPFLRRCSPDVCHDYALSNFKVHSVMGTGHNNCDYGVLPGVLSLNVMQPVGERWKTANSKCPLQNLMAGDARTGPVKVMLFGDSVDAHMAYAWCALLQQPLLFTPTSIKGSVAAFAASVKTKATGGSGNNSTAAAGGEEGCCKDRDVLYYCKPPSGDQQAADRISIGMFHLPGVHLDGPYHTGVKGNFLTRIPTALKAYNATFGGPPDLVIMHSNFWDQTRMWEQQQPGYGQLNKLLPDVVFSYSSNFSLLLSTTREYLPEDTLLATRTAAFPSFGANWLGRWSYILQLNNAAAEVTRLHGLPVIDLGGMVFGLEPKQYLDDQHHPNKLVLLECANIALNLLQQQRKRLAQERQSGKQQQQQLPVTIVSGATGRPIADGDSSARSSSSSLPPASAAAQVVTGNSSQSSSAGATKQGGGGGGSGAVQSSGQGAQQQIQPPSRKADGEG